MRRVGPRQEQRQDDPGRARPAVAADRLVLLGDPVVVAALPQRLAEVVQTGAQQTGPDLAVLVDERLLLFLESAGIVLDLLTFAVVGRQHLFQLELERLPHRQPSPESGAAPGA
jgi:hypothetical protein